MKRFLTSEQIICVREAFLTIDRVADRIILRYVAHPLKSSEAREFAQHGFGRRVGTLRRCIQNVFRIVPPGTVKIPSKAKLYDAQINLQAFIANVYGSIDNLAWIWVHERGLVNEVARGRVGFRPHHEEVRSSLSADFQAYLKEVDAWLAYVIEYRDSLAHRIPLYIPPGGFRSKDAKQYNELMEAMNRALSREDAAEYDSLSDAQSKLLLFQPLMTHSLTETVDRYAFHVQMIADFRTVVKLGEKMLLELSPARPV